MKVEQIKIQTNSSQVLAELQEVQDMSIVTSEIVQENNLYNEESYNSLNEAIANATLSQYALGNAIISTTNLMDLQRATMIENFAEVVGLTQAINENLESNQNHSISIGESIAMISQAITQMQTNTQAISDNTDKLTENEKEHWAWRTVAGIAATAQILLTSLTAMHTIVSSIDSVAKTKSAAATKKEVAADKVATKSKTARAVAGLSAIIMSAPFIGIALGVAAIAAVAGGVIAVRRAVAPKMATGGIVSAPTLALVGEGRYPEAVVPLGSSPQFAGMKQDIANAVLQGMVALDRAREGRKSNGSSSEVVLNIDGARIARALLPQLDQEYRRTGRHLAIRGI